MSINLQVTPSLLVEATQFLRGGNDDEVKILSKKVEDISADLAAKNEQIKQQTRVAKEALDDLISMDQQLKQQDIMLKEETTLREKADSDIRTLQRQFEVVFQQKSAAESSVLQLNGALKECMERVRRVREEQEHMMIETLNAKNVEWENAKAELETENAQLKRQVWESRAENSAMSKSLQERAKSLVEMNEAKSKAESEVKVLQVQIETLDKEMDGCKYELHVLKKELQIRNDEKEYSRKAAEAAHKQHLDSVKKIAKLDSECQRLRALIRKKLPGPAALAQMRMEADHVHGKPETAHDGSRKKKLSSTRSLQNPAEQEIARENAGKELEALTDRLVAMEDETKLLREVLVRRTGELQAARQMCARMASKLSTAEGLLEAIAGGQALPITAAATAAAGVEKSQEGMDSEEGDNDEEVSCAESWATALMTELSNLRSDDGTKEDDGHKQSSKPDENESGDDNSVNVCEGLAFEEAQRAHEISPSVPDSGATSTEMVPDSGHNRAISTEIEPPSTDFALQAQTQRADHLEEQLRSAHEELKQSRARVSDLETDLLELRSSAEKYVAELTEVRSSAASSVAELARAAALADELRAELAAARAELEQSQQRIASLTTELEERTTQNRELQRSTANVADGEADAKARKVREVAAAKAQLAECQRTIVALGNQLKSLTSSSGVDSVDGSFDSSLESATSTDHKLLPLASHVDLIAGSFDDEDPSPLPPPDFHARPRRAHSGCVRTRGGRLISAEQLWSSNYVSGPLDPDLYHRNHAQLAASYRSDARKALPPSDLYVGRMYLQSPIHEYATTDAANYNYSPPDTALSSPARSPARFDLQLENTGRRKAGAGSAAVRTNLLKSLNKAAATGPTRAPAVAKPLKVVTTSRFARFFARKTQQ